MVQKQNTNEISIYVSFNGKWNVKPWEPQTGWQANLMGIKLHQHGDKYLKWTIILVFRADQSLGVMYL